MDKIEKEYYKLYMILTNIPDSQKQKIPKELFDYLVMNMEVDKKFEIDINKGLLNQGYLPITNAFLVEIFSRYISEDKDKWRKYNLICRNMIEKEKSEKTTVNSLSQYNKTVENKETNEYIENKYSNLPIHKKNIINKIIDYIKNIFLRHN